MSRLTDKQVNTLMDCCRYLELYEGWSNADLKGATPDLRGALKKFRRDIARLLIEDMNLTAKDPYEGAPAPAREMSDELKAEVAWALDEATRQRDNVRDQMSLGGDELTVNWRSGLHSRWKRFIALITALSDGQA